MENKVIKAGTKIVIGMDAGMAGTDSMEAFILMRDFTEDELSDTAWQSGLNHAEMYGVYPTPDDLNEDDEEEGGDEYSDNIEGWWELYNEEEHESKCMYGTQQEVHFQELY